MKHQEIEEREIVEAYLRGEISEDDRQAFEEHFFACEECFAELRRTEKFIGGVREAAESGLLSAASGREPAFGRWWQSAFGLAWATAALLLVTTSWLAFFELPRGRREIARQRATIDAERASRQGLEQQLAMVRPPTAEGNLPLAMLEANRAGQANEITMPAGASRLVLWIELDPGVRYSTYRLQIHDHAGSKLEVIEGLRKNSHGALAASVPAARLPAATYTVLLHGEGSGQGALVAEYRLVVRR